MKPQRGYSDAQLSGLLSARLSRWMSLTDLGRDEVGRPALAPASVDILPAKLDRTVK
jgi:hypothetical protein